MLKAIHFHITIDGINMQVKIDISPECYSLWICSLLHLYQRPRIYMSDLIKTSENNQTSEFTTFFLLPSNLLKPDFRILLSWRLELSFLRFLPQSHLENSIKESNNERYPKLVLWEKGLVLEDTYLRRINNLANNGNRVW